MEREREYGIDALRIVSMWMVVVLHVLGQGGVLKNLEWPSFRYAIAWFLEAAAYGAVNCYGLISGYVGVHSKPKYSSILFLWIQVVFYSVTISAVAHFLLPKMVHGKEWMNGFFPVNFKYYWYFTAYFFISFLFPLINKMLLAATEKEIVSGITAVTVLLVINETVFQQDAFDVMKGYSPIWLLLLYMMGGCIRLHGEKLWAYRWIKKHAVLAFFIGTAAAWGVKVSLGYKEISLILGRKITASVLMSYVSPAIIFSSVALFSLFVGWKPSANVCKWIGKTSPAAFGVYLIHVHPQVWKYCVKDAFVPFVHLKAYVLPFAVVGVAIGIFVLCIAIDLLRGKLFDLLRVKASCQRLMKKVGLS